MSNRLRKNKRLTLQDIAEDLHISKTTVSRVLSGKGRIGQATKELVMEYVRTHDYHPNLMAKGLAEAKTWNIGVVLQGNAAMSDMPFFQNCLFGVASEVKARNYDVLLAINDGDGTDGLERILRMQKIDAVILTRVLENDKNVELLKESEMPFVAIGSYDDETVVQVDAPIEEAGRIFTKQIVENAGGAENIIFLCGKQNIVVNKLRLRGFLGAMSDLGKSERDYAVVSALDGAADVKNALAGFRGNLVICADDILCEGAIEWQKEENSIAKIVSFHNSLSLSKCRVSAIEIDAYALGKKAADILLSRLEGKETAVRNYVDYHFLF